MRGFVPQAPGPLAGPSVKQRRRRPIGQSPDSVHLLFAHDEQISGQWRPRTIALGFLLAMGSAIAHAGNQPALRSSASAIQVTARLPEKLGIELPLPAASLSMRPFALVEMAQSVTITTIWSFERGRAAVAVMALFAAGRSKGSFQYADASVKDACESALSGRAFGRITYPLVSHPLTETGLVIFDEPLTPGVNDRTSRTDAIEIQKDATAEWDTPDRCSRGTLTLVAEAL